MWTASCASSEESAREVVERQGSVTGLLIHHCAPGWNSAGRGSKESLLMVSEQSPVDLIVQVPGIAFRLDRSRRNRDDSVNA
jgi:hypothetical protein